MSKYQPLTERLAGDPGPEWRASFADIENVLGFPLPKAARAGTVWWSNDADRAQARAWTGAGWKVAEVDPGAESVVFRRAVSEAAMQNPLVAEEAALEVAPQPRRSRWRLTAAITAGAALAAGVGALVVRGLVRRGRTPNL